MFWLGGWLLLWWREGRRAIERGISVYGGNLEGRKRDDVDGGGGGNGKEREFWRFAVEV